MIKMIEDTSESCMLSDTPLVTYSGAECVFICKLAGH